MGILSGYGYAVESGSERVEEQNKAKQTTQKNQTNQVNKSHQNNSKNKAIVTNSVLPSIREKSAESSIPFTPQNSNVNTLNSGSKGNLLQLFSGLFVVIISVIVMLWLIKRFSRFNYAGQQTVKVLGGISLGTREKIVLIEVGSEQLLVGVAPGRVNLLHQLQEPVEVKPSLESFQSVLSKRFKGIFKRDQNK
ncbi:hypothetical protein MNBD_GAMMA12-3035 [hydrothermal vent metagenome]|uniref:Flagellar protein n=1 Tax=hydrothermal vent metagenome TaxID=652676 RepID=A0A3B0Y942_9ZZZZ